MHAQRFDRPCEFVPLHAHSTVLCRFGARSCIFQAVHVAVWTAACMPCVDCSPRGLGLRSWPWLVRPILFRLSSLNARASLRTLDRVENQEGFEEVACTPIALSLHALKLQCSHCMQCVRRLSELSRLTLHAPIAEVHAGLRGTHTSAVQFSLLFSTHICDQTSWLDCVCMHTPTHHSDRMHAGPGQGGQSHWAQRINVEEGRVGAHNISDALEAALAPVSLQYNLSFQVSRSSLYHSQPCTHALT